MKYRTKVINKGRLLDDLIKTNLLILFDISKNDFLKDFGIEHESSQLLEDIEIGDILKIDKQEFPIIKIGKIANKEFGETGHTTFKIGNEIEPDNENMILVLGEKFPKIEEGTVIEIS